MQGQGREEEASGLVWSGKESERPSKRVRDRGGQRRIETESQKTKTCRQTRRQRHRGEQTGQSAPERHRHSTKLEPKIKATHAETGIRARARGERGGGLHRGSPEVEGAGALQERPNATAATAGPAPTPRRAGAEGVRPDARQGAPWPRGQTCRPGSGRGRSGGGEGRGPGRGRGGGGLPGRFLARRPPL